MAFNPNNGVPETKQEKSFIDNLTFYGEEIIFREEKIKTEASDPFLSSTLPDEKKEIYGRYKVIKTGIKQQEYKVGDYILVYKNGLPNEIKIEGVGTLENTYSLPTSQRVYCKIDG